MICATVPFFATAADTNTKPAANSEKIPYNLHPEHDKTDIFAIPVDDSEEEEDQEMADLKALQAKEQTKEQDKKSK